MQPHTHVSPGQRADSLPAPAGGAQVFQTTWRGMPVQFILDGRAFTIREAARHTEFVWQHVRGIALAISPRRFRGPTTYIYVSYARVLSAPPTIVPVHVDLADPQCRAMIEVLKRTPYWRGQGSALSVNTALGYSNSTVYFIVGGILLVCFVFALVAVGLVVVLTDRYKNQNTKPPPTQHCLVEVWKSPLTAEPERSKE